MKKLFMFLASLAVAFTLTSCVSAAYAQTDEVYTTTSDENVNVQMIISYGVPVLDEANFVMYYVYNGWYYYPYWITDRYYFHVYRHPLAVDYYRRWYRPIPRDFHRHYRYEMTPRHHRHDFHGRRPHFDRPNHHGTNRMRPNVNHNRPMPNINRGSSIGNSRPMVQPRSSTRNSSSGGHFGGSRMGGRR